MPNLAKKSIAHYDTEGWRSMTAALWNDFWTVTEWTDPAGSLLLWAHSGQDAHVAPLLAQ